MGKTKKRKRPQGNPAKLPTHGRLPIPWVTRRSTEHPPGAMDVSVAHGWDEEGRPIRAIQSESLYRDEQGWLWQPSVTDLSGEPEFSQVHPERQRRCMDELRCQVCGRRVTDQRPARWVMAGMEDDANVGDLPPEGTAITTAHPPVCVKCLDLAYAKCPHLRRHGPPVVVCEAVSRHGVVADLYDYRPGEAGLVRVGQKDLTLDSPEAGMAIARQRIVALHGWSVVSDKIVDTSDQGEHDVADD